MVQNCFLGADLLFNSDIVNSLLETNGGRDRRPNFFFFFFFVVWSALIVRGVGVVAGVRKSYLGLADI